MSSRLTNTSWRLGRVKQSARNQVRVFSSNQGDRAWRNDTPAGSSTGVFVYIPESNISWPDQRLGVLSSQTDPNFSLPGNISANPSLIYPTDTPTTPIKLKETLTYPSDQETQLQTIYIANDFIKYTPGSEMEVLSTPSVLSSFPSLPSSDKLEVVAHTAPLLLRKELNGLFSGQNIMEGPLTIITISMRTAHDMSTWSDDVEEEREQLTEHTVVMAKEICGRLKEEGYFADFIDPCSGTPHYGPHSNTTMFETDEKLRLLSGFRIEDLGCCKVISHSKFGRNVFVGCVVTNAASQSDVMENILHDIAI